MPSTKSKTTATENGKDERSFDVNYEIEVIDELPERQGQGQIRSVLKDQMEKVMRDEKFHGKWVRIGKYGKSTAATAAKNVLQQRHGRSPAVDGVKFETRRIDDGAYTGLFVRYTPDQVVAGAREAHDAAERERKAKLKAERDEKARAEAQAKADAEQEG